MTASSRQSAGLLVFRRAEGRLEVFLVHPGGPYWARKDAGAWTIPKGEFGEGEDALEAAKREFHEETSFGIEGRFAPLEPVRQAGGKIVSAWAVEADCDAGSIRSNTFTLEWPPRSGRFQEFPEVDRASWFALADARERILPSQAPLLDQLERLQRQG